MLLQDKVAVIYGAAGAIGGAVARAFAAEDVREVVLPDRAPGGPVASDRASRMTGTTVNLSMGSLDD